MCSVLVLREFIRERLTAAAEDIFTEVENTLRMLEISWRTQINRGLTGLQQKVSNEEVLNDQQLWNQERNQNFDQEDAEPLQEELCMGQDEEQLPLKQEETLMMPQIEQIFGTSEISMVRFGEEIDHQHQLLETSWKPVIKLHKKEPPQQHVDEEEVLTDRQLWNQDRNWILDQQEQEPPHIKENPEEPEPPKSKQNQEEPEQPQTQDSKEKTEPPLIKRNYQELVPPRIKQNQEESEPPLIKQNQEELCIFKEEERLVRHPDYETFMVPPTDEKNDQSEPEPNTERVDSGTSAGNEIQDQDGGKRVESEPPQTYEVKFMKSSQRKKRKHAEGSSGSESLIEAGAAFRRASSLMSHHTTSTAENTFSAGPHGGELSSLSASRELSHLSERGPFGTSPSNLSGANCDQRSPTAESLYSCNTCGKRFRFNCRYLSHMRTHTGEKPFSCRECGKSFTQGGSLWRHVRTHSGEKPFLCITCGKSFSQRTGLLGHIRTQHTGEKPCSCGEPGH